MLLFIFIHNEKFEAKAVVFTPLRQGPVNRDGRFLKSDEQANRQDAFHAHADIYFAEFGTKFSDTAPAFREVDDESLSVMVTGKRGRKLSGKPRDAAGASCCFPL